MSDLALPLTISWRVFIPVVPLRSLIAFSNWVFRCSSVSALCLLKRRPPGVAGNSTIPGSLRPDETTRVASGQQLLLATRVPGCPSCAGRVLVCPGVTTTLTSNHFPHLTACSFNKLPVTSITTVSMRHPFERLRHPSVGREARLYPVSVPGTATSRSKAAGVDPSRCRSKGHGPRPPTDGQPVIIGGKLEPCSPGDTRVSYLFSCQQSRRRRLCPLQKVIRPFSGSIFLMSRSATFCRSAHSLKSPLSCRYLTIAVASLVVISS